MQNQRAVEAVYSATYVEDYIDALENLPDEIQRLLTRMRETDIDCQNYTTDVKANMAILLDLDVKGFQNEEEENRFTSIKNRIQRLLMNIQEIGDEKIQIAQHIQDFTENRLRQLELDKKTLEQSNRSETHSHEAIIQQQSTVRETSAKSADRPSEGRSLKRARRARLDPSMSNSPHTPASKASSSTNHNTPAEKRVERVEAPSVSTPAPPPAPTPAPSTPAVPTPVVTPIHTPSTSAAVIAPPPAPIAKPVKTTASGSSSRRDSEASNSSSATPAQTHKKSSIDLGTPAEAPVDRERKRSESTSSTRTPKKQYNQHHEKKQSMKQKAEKRAAAAAKKKKTRQMDDSPPMNIPAEPDEPTYCLCDQVSYGEMIGCDNDLCPIEWFHFSCVSLSIKPKGKWFCPKCRGERPNIMKPKSIFLKELEKYNREKEEKA